MRKRQKRKRKQKQNMTIKSGLAVTGLFNILISNPKRLECGRLYGLMCSLRLQFFSVHNLLYNQEVSSSGTYNTYHGVMFFFFF